MRVQQKLSKEAVRARKELQERHKSRSCERHMNHEEQERQEWAAFRDLLRGGAGLSRDSHPTLPLPTRQRRQ